MTQQELVASSRPILDARQTKPQFQVDAYFVCLSLPPKKLVRRAAYWYSLWAHRRSWTWKGYLEVDLSPEEDTEALELLQQAQGAQS